MQPDWSLKVTPSRRFLMFVERTSTLREKRDTFVELADHVPADMCGSNVGKPSKALHGTQPAEASWRDELKRRAC